MEDGQTATSVPHHHNLFLDNIHNEDYTAWKTATSIRLHKDLDLDEHIHEFREQADSITTARGAKKKLSQHLRRLKCSYTMDTTNSSDSSVDTSPSKRVRRRKHKTRRNHTPTSGFLQVTPNQSGTITIETADWRNRLTPEDRTFVQAYNAKVKHGESTESLGTPTSFTIVKPRLTTQQKRKPINPAPSLSDDTSVDTTPPKKKPKKKTERKKIRFHVEDGTDVDT